MNNSECCDAPLLNYNDGLGLCSDCKEWAGQIKDETTMNKETLSKISALLSEARTLLDDMDASFDDDIQANWLYQLETWETDIDSVLETMNKETTE